MSDYRIVVQRTGRIIRQKFYVTAVAANGETIWTTELYRDKDHALEVAQTWAGYCDGNLINAT